MQFKRKSPRARKAARKKRIAALKRRSLIGGVIVLLLLLVNWGVVSCDTRQAEPFAGGHPVQVTGPDLNVREYGTGPRDGAVVLISGYTTSIEFWDRVAPGLAHAGHRVFAIDPVGHGGSESPRNAYAYGADGQAEALARTIRALDLRRVTLVGHSMGGAIVTYLAEKEPALVGKIAIVDSFSSPGHGDLPFFKTLACLPVIGPAFDRFRQVRFFSEDGVQTAFATPIPDEAFRSLERMTWTGFCKSTALQRLNEQMPLAERLRDTGKPATVIWGAKDALTPADPNVAEFRKAGFRVHVIADSGHSPHVETPATLVRILREFLG